MDNALVSLAFAVIIVVCSSLLFLLLRIWLKKKTALLWAAVAGIVLTAISFQPARLTSPRIISHDSLIRIGLALQQYSEKNDGWMPVNIESAMKDYGAERFLIDRESQKVFVYIGSGRKWNSSPDLIVAYSPTDPGERLALFADGHVALLKSAEFIQALERSNQLTTELPVSH